MWPWSYVRNSAMADAKNTETAVQNERAISLSKVNCTVKVSFVIR